MISTEALDVTHFHEVVGVLGKVQPWRHFSTIECEVVTETSSPITCVDGCASRWIHANTAETDLAPVVTSYVEPVTCCGRSLEVSCKHVSGVAIFDIERCFEIDS